MKVSLARLLDRHGTLVCACLLTLAGLLVFRDFIALQKMFLFKDIGSDSININYPGLYHLAHYLRTDGMPRWSFNQGMGQNIFPGCVTDPFSAVLLALGENRLPYAIGYMELCKCICAGLLFFAFLGKRGCSRFSAVAGGLLYAFSGFLVLGSCWNVFSTEAVYLALALYAFEKLYQNNAWPLFPVSVALVAVNQPFDLLLFGVFLAPYSVFRLWEDGTFNRKSITGLSLKLAGCGALGTAASAFFTIPDIVQMIDSPRVKGGASISGILFSKPVFAFEGPDFGHGYFLTAIMRFFSSDMLGTGSGFRGWNNYMEAPLFYCGLINVLLLPQAFWLPGTRKKIACAALLGFFVLPVIFPFFRYFFWGFTGDYFRLYSLFVVVPVLLVSLRALSGIGRDRRINAVILFASLCVSLIVLYYPFKSGGSAPVAEAAPQRAAAVFLVGYAVLMYLTGFARTRSFVRPLLLAAVIAELVYFSNITVNHRPVVTAAETGRKTGFNDFTVDALRFLRNADTSFYRVNKDFSSSPAVCGSLNDAKIQDFRGTPSYNSFNQRYYIRFLIEMGIIHADVEPETRWAPGLTGIETIPGMPHADYVSYLHPFASVKYALTKANPRDLLRYGYDSIASAGDLAILRNRNFLPLGFSYGTYLPRDTFETLRAQDKCTALYKACVLDGAAIPAAGMPEYRFPRAPYVYSAADFANDIARLKADTLRMTRHSQNAVGGTVTFDRTMILFFSIPFDKGWSATVDGEGARLFPANIGFTGLLVGKGTHRVELRFEPPFLRLGALISAFAAALFAGLFFARRRGFARPKK